jgi:hypothetical protein
MEIRTGSRLRSQIDDTEIIVIRALPGDVALTCGGHPMIKQVAQPAPGLTAKDNASDGTHLGKRYTLAGTDLEVLVTKPGHGTLALGCQALTLKDVRPLPSSD